MKSTSQILWLLQRASAALMLVFVLVHLGLMIVAVQGGLTASEILDRTRGSVGWLSFYSIFVILVSIHAPIGLRNILFEQWSASRKISSPLAILYGFLVCILGLRACWAVFSGGSA
jgi:fumarate reductase subunit C